MLFLRTKEGKASAQESRLWFTAHLIVLASLREGLSSGTSSSSKGAESRRAGGKGSELERGSIAMEKGENQPADH